MTENSTKLAFKKYLQLKKDATKNLTKLEQNELKKMEEEAIVKRVIKRDRYATDAEYREKQQAHARISMKKTKAKMKDVQVDVVEEPEDIEQVEEEEPQYVVEKTKFHPSKLF